MEDTIIPFLTLEMLISSILQKQPTNFQHIVCRILVKASTSVYSFLLKNFVQASQAPDPFLSSLTGAKMG